MTFNPESRIFEKIDADNAYEKAREMLEESAINPDDFKGENGYSEEQIEIDKNEVERLENEFRKSETPEGEEVQKLATIFEAVIHENAELSNWLGPNGFTVKTSRFDDIKNGVDTVVEFSKTEQPSEYLALAIDVTFSSDTGKKLDRIKKEIENGELAHIEYFVSDHSPRRRLEKVPRVVIGADANTVKKLEELWLEKEKEKLGAHWIQFQILEEIIAQFKAFESYAEKNGKKEIANIYKRERTLVENIYKEKTELMKDSGERDTAFYTMKESLKNLFRIKESTGIKA